MCASHLPKQTNKQKKQRGGGGMCVFASTYIDIPGRGQRGLATLLCLQG